MSFFQSCGVKCGNKSKDLHKNHCWRGWNYVMRFHKTFPIIFLVTDCQVPNCQSYIVNFQVGSNGQIIQIILSISRLAQIGKLSKLYFHFPGWFLWANCQNHISNFLVSSNEQIVKENIPGWLNLHHTCSFCWEVGILIHQLNIVHIYLAKSGKYKKIMKFKISR